MEKIKIAVTGGPSGGKTTLIEALQKDLPNQLSIVPEAASILYRGGFPRKSTSYARQHTQRAIYFVQQELEGLALQEAKAPVLVCDRGSLDSIAYWPGTEDDFFKSLNTTREKELARYDWVLHLDTADQEYFDTSNVVRTESHQEALELNARTLAAWGGHPRRIVIPHSDQFLEKISSAKTAIRLIMQGLSYEAVREKIFPVSN